jgi:hypothetical protein
MAEEFLADLNHLHGIRVNHFSTSMMSKYKVHKFSVMLSSRQSLCKQFENEPMGCSFGTISPLKGCLIHFNFRETKY